MRLRHAPANWHFPHRPLRFGSSWRGHELALRLLQLGAVILLAAFGVKLIAQGLVLVVEALARWVS
jgi:hypothetical protein